MLLDDFQGMEIVVVVVVVFGQFVQFITDFWREDLPTSSFGR